ncbi:L-rhamnose mutarotase [Catalinimonas alkaloidigena]|uniref:L-rhamnose mutarotase n=1 Tax=Catalinimonas alkaloidigena TaxID=1075417 RepID=UPI002404DB70|nr:L-rhamnose mutarotase [Catalinimonas alkaloidigena]MDF9797172.1 L-rhamnose mutarotase [Catalinimonas alkaloidigena]
MKRKAFTMKLIAGFEEEYKKRHDEIWPELSQSLKEAGIHDYSIYLDEESLTLFAVQKVDDHYDGNQLASHPVVRRWWDYMADIMETNPDNSPVTKALQEVFHID